MMKGGVVMPDFTNIKTGDILKIQFPEEFVEDKNKKGSITKYCIPLIPSMARKLENWNWGTTQVLITTTKSYCKNNATNVEIPAGVYECFETDTYIICSKSYPIPNEVLEKGEKVGTLTEEHLEEVRLAMAVGFDIVKLDDE